MRWRACAAQASGSAADAQRSRKLSTGAIPARAGLAMHFFILFFGYALDGASASSNSLGMHQPCLALFVIVMTFCCVLKCRLALVEPGLAAAQPLVHQQPSMHVTNCT